MAGVLALLAAPAVMAHQAVPANSSCAWQKNYPIDGLYGRLTEIAVREYQDHHNLKEDGVAGPKTHAALGLPYHRKLSKGMKGADVRLLQATMAAHKHWTKPAPRPTMKPTPRPTPMWTPPPTPMPTPAWTPPPATPEPTPMPTMAPTPEPMDMTARDTPTLELRGGNWFLPTAAGGTNYDWGLTRPTYWGNGTLWFGNVGVGGGVTVLPQIFSNASATPLIQANTMMYDGLLKFRSSYGHHTLLLGYRGLGQGDANFGTAGYQANWPLFGTDWLWLQGRAQGGYGKTNGAPGMGYFLDGDAGLALRMGFLSLEGGFRHLRLDPGIPGAMVDTNGPVGSVRLAF